MDETELRRLEGLADTDPELAEDGGLFLTKAHVRALIAEIRELRRRLAVSQPGGYRPGFYWDEEAGKYVFPD